MEAKAKGSGAPAFVKPIGAVSLGLPPVPPLPGLSGLARGAPGPPPAPVRSTPRDEEAPSPLEARPAPGSQDLARRGSRVWKRSTWLKAWRERWMLLSDGEVRFFAEDIASISGLTARGVSTITVPSAPSTARAGGGAGTERTELSTGPVRRRQLTASFPLASIRGVWVVEERRFGRGHCFVLHVQGGSDAWGWQVAVQASGPIEQGVWVSMVQQAAVAAALAPTPRPPPSLTAAPEGPQGADGAAPKAKSPGKAAPPALKPPPPKGSPKAKAGGKAPPPKGLPPKAKPPPGGKGAPASKATAPAQPKPKAPPLGRKLQVKVMDQQVRLEETVFSGMLDVGSPPAPSPALEGEHDSPRNRYTVNTSSDSDSIAERLRETFTPRETTERGMRARRSLEAAKKRHARKAVLDNRTAQNVEIVLKKLSVSVEDLRLIVERMDFDTTLAGEDFERLREVIPPPDQLRTLLSFQGDIMELRSIERHILRLASIDRLGPRLHVLALKKSLLSRRQQLLQDTNCVRTACQELMNSALLRDLLEAVLRMFNFVNHGNERLEKGTVRGFDITSAIRIAEFKAVSFSPGCGSPSPSRGSSALPSPRGRSGSEGCIDLSAIENFTGLHFCVTQVLTKKPKSTVAEFVQQFKSLGAAAGLNLRCLAKDAAELLKEARFLERELGEHRETYDNPIGTATAPVKARSPRKLGQERSSPVDAGSSGAKGDEEGIGRSQSRCSGDLAPLLSPVPEECSARLRQTVLSNHSFVVASPRRVWDRVAGCVLGSVARSLPEGAVWIREILEMPSQDLTTRPRYKWRRMRVGPGRVLEVHGTTSVRIVGLPGIVVEPFAQESGTFNTSPPLTGRFAGLLLHFRYGFEVVEQAPSQSSSRPPLRFACESVGELERWLSVLRTESKTSGTGWLERLQPATMLRREQSKRRWFVMNHDLNMLVYYKDPTSAWRAPARPMGSVRLADRGCGAVALGRGAEDMPPSEALQAMMAIEGRPWSLAVRGSRGEWHSLVAPDEASQVRWLQAIRGPAGVCASIPEEDIARQVSTSQDGGSDGCEMLPLAPAPVTPRRPSAGSMDSSHDSSAMSPVWSSPCSRGPSCESISPQYPAKNEADRPFAGASPDAATTTPGTCAAARIASDSSQCSSSQCSTPRSSLAGSSPPLAARTPPTVQAAEDASRFGMSSPLGAVPPLPPSAGGASADNPGSAPAAQPGKPFHGPPLQLPLRLQPQLAPADGPASLEFSPPDRLGGACSPMADGQLSSSKVETPAVAGAPISRPCPPLALGGPSPRALGSTRAQPRQGPTPRSPQKISAAQPEASPPEEGEEAVPEPESPKELQQPRMPVPLLNLQNLGGGSALEGLRRGPQAQPSVAAQRSSRRRSSTLESMDSDTDTDSSTTESCSITESREDSRLDSKDSSAYERAPALSARLPMVKRLEKLKDSAMLAEVEVRGAVTEASKLASQTMRYFGQVPPTFDEELKDIAEFAQSLQHFLQAVNQLIREVVAAWKEIEQQNQVRGRNGLGDMKFTTPRDWVPMSARGQRARREKVGLLTLD